MRVIQEKITYINEKGESIELVDTSPYLFFSIEGIDGLKNKINTMKGYNQDGVSSISSSIDPRNISVQGVLNADYEEEFVTKKKEIIKVFNPKYKGTLIYKNSIKEYSIKCEVEIAPVFSDIIDDNIGKFLVVLLCPNPYWNDITESKSEIALWKGDFEFPLEITSNGIELGHREPSLIVNVFNSGDVECGMKIEFKALGTLKNPSLFNVNTREFIKVNKEMVAGEIITITTGFGGKRVKSSVNGVIINSFSFLDLQSTFLKLNVGDNLFRYDADENLDNLEVSIYYTPQYLGV